MRLGLNILTVISVSPSYISIYHIAEFLLFAGLTKRIPNSYLTVKSSQPHNHFLLKTLSEGRKEELWDGLTVSRFFKQVPVGTTIADWW